MSFIYGNPDEGIDGAIARGVPEQTAAEIFDEIMDFANYAFNKAHAVCYAVVSYRTAYLKCHYPREYLAALLTSVLDVPGKISEYIAEAKEMGKMCIRDRQNKDLRGFGFVPVPPNLFDASIVPWLSYQSLTLNVFDSGTYLAPVITAGKYTERDGRQIGRAHV